MSVPDLVGRRVLLQPMRLQDADLVVRWVNEPAQRRFWFGREASRSEVLARWPPVFFDDAYPQKGRIFRIDAGGAPVGAALYNPVWGLPRSARLELVLDAFVEADVGADALDALARYLPEALHVEDLWAEVHPDDARALAAFGRAGFEAHGRTADQGLAILRRSRAGAASTKPK